VKFLCVPCDKPMRLEGKSGDGGSIALTYACPECGYEFAMLTNPMETQLVSSLGVQIGPEGPSGAKCPFTGMARELTEAGTLLWTADARERMANVPEFVRPMVQSGIEQFARDKGYAEIDARVLEEARGFFGME
jgi:hypothetical protein